VPIALGQHWVLQSGIFLALLDVGVHALGQGLDDVRIGLGHILKFERVLEQIVELDLREEVEVGFSLNRSRSDSVLIDEPGSSRSKEGRPIFASARSSRLMGRQDHQKRYFNNSVNLEKHIRPD
jgi:hypothetical protein